MLFALTLIFPPALMLAVLAMERVERPLNDVKIGDQVAELIRSSAAEEVELLVSDSCARPVDRHWRRRARLARIARLRSTRAAARG
jgi:cyanophycinase-like exopeptidase